MKPTIRWFLAVPLALTSCGGGDLDLTAEYAKVAELVPEDAIAFARLASIDAVVAHIKDVVVAAGEDPDQVDVGEVFDLMGPLVGNADLIDRTRPIGASLSLSTGAPPMPVLIVPSSDPEAYAASFTAQPGMSSPVASDGYVVISFGPSYTKPRAAPAITAGLAAGTVAMRADVEDALTVFRPMIDLGLGQFERMMAQEMTADVSGMDGEQFAAMYATVIRSIVESASSFEVALDYVDGDLDASGKLTVRAGSPMDGWSSDAEVDVSDFVSRLDGEGGYEMVAAADFAALSKRFEGFYEQLLAVYPEPVQAMMRPFFVGYQEVYAHLGQAMALSGRFGGDGGMRMKLFLEPDDAEAMIGSYAKMVDEGPFAALGVRISEARQSEVAGVPVRDFDLGIDFDALMAHLGAEASDDARAELESILPLFFGDQDAVTIRVATEQQRVLVAIGGDQAYRDAAVERLGAGDGAPSAQFERALERVAGTNPLYVQRMDFGRMMVDMFEVIRKADPSRRTPLPIAEGSVDMTVYGGIEGREWRAGIIWDIAAFAKLMKSMMPR